jgi:hypothetical protein
LKIERQKGGVITWSRNFFQRLTDASEKIRFHACMESLIFSITDSAVDSWTLVTNKSPC